MGRVGGRSWGERQYCTVQVSIIRWTIRDKEAYCQRAHVPFYERFLCRYEIFTRGPVITALEGFVRLEFVLMAPPSEELSADPSLALFFTGEPDMSVLLFWKKSATRMGDESPAAV